MNRKKILGFILLTFLTGCSDVWLGESREEVILEGERINIISPYFELSENDFIKDPITLKGNSSLPKELDKDWSSRVGSSDDLINFSFEPVISEDKIYTLSDNGVVSCFDSNTGRRKWKVLVSRKKEKTIGILGGGIQVAKGKIFVSTGFGDIFALDKNNGGMIWRYSSVAPFNGAPYIHNDVVISVDRENETIALSESDGEIVWKKKASPEGVSILSNLQITGNSKIIVPTYTSGEIFAIIPNNGKVIWSDILMMSEKSNSINAVSEISASSIINNNILIATGLNNQTVGMDLKTGKRIWQIKVRSKRTPVSIDNYVYLISGNNELIAISSENGKVYWKKDLNNLYKNEGVDWSSMTIYNNHIVMNNSNRELVFISAINGELKFKQRVKGFSYSAPIFHNGKVYLLKGSDRLYAYDLN